MRVLPLLFLSAMLGGRANPAGAAEPNWPQFRGAEARGVSTNAKLPDRWSAKENVEWQAEIPGRGWSSPIVWGNRAFLTTVVSSGTMEEPKKGLYLGGEMCLATPALVGDRLLIRTDKHLYSIRNSGPPRP